MLRFSATARHLAASVAGLVLAAATISPAKADTKAFAVSWFGVSTYFGGDSDCPHGLNPMSTEFYHRELLRLGYSEADATDLLKDFPGNNPFSKEGRYINIIGARAPNKQNVYMHPDLVPDPELKLVEGKSPMASISTARLICRSSFTDPDTGEKGIKNQFFRAIGCVRSFRAPPPSHPTLSASQWDILRDQVPAWLIVIHGITDGKNDQNVTVETWRASETVTRDRPAISART